MHRIGLYGVDQLLVTSNPRFSVDRNIIDEKNDDDDVQYGQMGGG